MQTLLHLFWGFTIARYFSKNKKAWLLGALFGVLPDLGAGPWIYFRNVLKYYDIYQIPQWTLNIYNSTHNLFTWALASFWLYFTFRKYLFLSMAYLTHIVTDVFSHCAPIGTKIFFPLSNWSYCSKLYRVAYGPSPIGRTKELTIIESIQYLILFLANIAFSRKNNPKW